MYFAGCGYGKQIEGQFSTVGSEDEEDSSSLNVKQRRELGYRWWEWDLGRGSKGVLFVCYEEGREVCL